MIPAARGLTLAVAMNRPSPFSGRWGASQTIRFPEVFALRVLGCIVVSAFITRTLDVAPQPGFSGRSALVLASLVVFVAAVIGLVCGGADAGF